MSRDTTLDQSSADDALIVALQGAQRSPAVDLLYRRYAGRFAAYLRRRGMAPADVEDAVQEAFIRLIRRAASFHPQGQGAAWIWTVARSAWLDLLRKPQLDMVSDLSALPEDTAIAPERADASQFQDCVDGQFSRFASAYPESAQAISWAAVDGLAATQIAELLGRTPGAAREFLSQTRKRLREYLEPCLGL